MKILTIFAHPDDETMFAGGTLALLARSGAETHYLCATRGEGGELGEPPVCSRIEIGTYRERELACAIQALGGGKLSFLGFRDPLIGDDQELYPYTKDLDDLVGCIRRHIQSVAPQAIITHGTNGEYGHPGHTLTHKAVYQAVQSLGEAAPLLYTFCANFPNHPRPRHANPDNPAHIILDVSPAMAYKTQAAYCHRSQHALFVRRRSQRVGYQLTIPETLLNIESLHRVDCPVDERPDDDLVELLTPWIKSCPV